MLLTFPCGSDLDDDEDNMHNILVMFKLIHFSISINDPTFAYIEF